MSDLNYKYFNSENSRLSLDCPEILWVGYSAVQGKKIWDCGSDYAQIYSIKNGVVKVFAYLGKGSYADTRKKLNEMKVGGLKWSIPNGLDDELCYFLKDNGFSGQDDYYWTTQTAPRHQGVVKINGVFGGRPNWSGRRPDCTEGLETASRDNMMILIASYNQYDDVVDLTPSKPNDGGSEITDIDNTTPNPATTPTPTPTPKPTPTPTPTPNSDTELGEAEGDGLTQEQLLLIGGGLIGLIILIVALRK